MSEHKKGLGRGIDALFTDSLSEAANEETVKDLPVEDIRPNPHQPRKKFDQDALQELADSIMQNGVLQPIIVRASSVKGYEIIAGERRLRASKIAGKDVIPAIVRDLTEAQMIELAVLENLQREDLTSMEEAEAYQTLMEKLNLTQEEVGKRLGKSRPYITNSLRLLKLPNEVQQMVQDGLISYGVARTLLSLKDDQKMIKLAKQAVKESLTVREVEQEVQKINNPKKSEKTIAQTPTKPNYIRESESQLQEKFSTDVLIKGKAKGDGRIEIGYTSQEDLTRILEILKVKIN